MKQTNKLKMIAAMAVSITVALFISSCSNDEFMDIWDDTIYKESSFYDISESIEYQQYLEKLFEFHNAIANPDTSKAIAVYIKDSLIVYISLQLI